MIRLREALLDALQTATRLLPWPTPTGLRRIGSPGPESPVLITGNYDLTVRRLCRALEGVDAWLVVAPSRGINVWCAAAGGMFTTHQVVTALKTSGIETVVRHRRAILPQLAATGVISREVTRRCGWKLRFGPVYATDLPEYLASRQKRSEPMRRVRFGLRERLEMAVAWAAPAALLVAGGSALLRPTWALLLAAWVTLLALAVFLVYDRIPGPRAALFAATGAALSTGLVAAFGGGTAALVTAPLVSLVLIGVLTFDYAGSTPIEGGSHFEARRWTITLDAERCDGIYSCFEVCPEACFETSTADRVIRLRHSERCVKCGACVVQCPSDALYFTDPDGRMIPPEVTRRYKLNLFGQRSVDLGVPETGPEPGS